MLGKPLPEFDTPSALAYAAENKENPSEPVFALIANDLFPFRKEAAEALKNMSVSAVLPLLHYEPLFLPDRNVSRMVLIYAKPLGGKVMPAKKAERPFSETELKDKFLYPMIAFLTEAAAQPFTCRGIRPDNLYYLDEAKTKIVVGDFLAANPAAEQPLFAETIESSMSQLLGRGEGRTADDIYSLAVTAWTLFLGYVPDSFLLNDEILNAKITLGSYPALTAKFEVPPFLLDFLKNCLADDAELRGNLSALALWQEGKKIPFAVIPKVKKTSRGYLFNGKNYFSPRELARAFVKEWNTATVDIYSDSFEIWLGRAFGDDVKILEDFIGLKKEAQLQNDLPRKNDVLLAKTCMLLDAKAPVRYRTLSFFPDALGAILAQAMQNGGDLSIISEVITYEIPGDWQGIMPENYISPSALYLSLAQEIKLNGWGYGLERCLYTLAHNCPCLSKILEKYYVTEAEELLVALNAEAKKVDNKQKPIDRHIAAFVAYKVSGVTKTTLDMLDSRQDFVFLETLLFIYASIQKQFGPPTLYGLCGWIGSLLAPVVDSYHNQNIRKRLEADIPKLVRKGSLVDLSAYLNDTQIRKEDKDGFTSATKEYIYTVQELEELEKKRPEVKKYSLFLGQQLSAIISVCAALLVAATLMMSMLF